MTIFIAWSSLLVITVIPGFGLLAATNLKFSAFERLVLGFVLGLALLCLGGALASWTQIDALRWLPPAISALGWFGYRKSTVRASLKQILLGLFGILVLIPTLLNTLDDQPTKWSGVWSFYADLPFQMALVAETGFRPGQTLPWSLGAPLEYTWLLHSALGAWGQIAGLSPDSIILFYWPIIYTILLPLLVGLLIWRVSRSYWAILIAELLLPFVRDSVVITNQHCQESLPRPSICPLDSKVSNPWFLISGFSGRRVLFESQGYGWQIFDSKFASLAQEHNRQLSQEFILHPKDRLLARLKQKGVASIFINPAFPNSGDYSRFARLVYNSADAQVWSLR